MPSDFVELNRTFIKIPDGFEGEERLRELELLEYRHDRSSELNWDGLLQEPRVVLLGEPGSGKTLEFKHQSELLCNADKYSFFLDLRELVDLRLCNLLSRKGEYLERFNAWMKSQEQAWFFLDAIDEARLRHYKDFRSALENFACDIDPRAISRLHVIVSSRITSWQTYSDREWLNGLLSQSIGSSKETSRVGENSRVESAAGTAELEQGEEARRSFKIFAMTPLSSVQVEIFADHRGADGQEFHKALTDRFIEPLARRPLDVENLLQYWKDKGGFDTYRNVLEYVVSRQLEEPGEDASRDILTPEQVCRGTETIAAAVIFCRSRDIALSTDSDGGLNANAALPASWEDAKVASLLDRAVFDVPMFGKVRFHHRQTEEFLTASWLHNLVVRQLRLHRLKRILFQVFSDGSLILRPSLAPVAAWLGCMEGEAATQVRSWIRQAKPELYFAWGDPSSLPVEYRQSLLDAVVTNYSGWEYTRIDVDRESLTRFAHSDLADYLGRHCIDKAVPEDLRSNFFYIAGFGKVSGLDDSALTVILDEKESSYLKESACNYLQDVGGDAALSKLAGNLDEIKAPSERLVASLMSVLFPDYLSDEQAIALIKCLNGIEEYSTGFCYQIARHFKQFESPEGVFRLMSVLLDVMSDGPPWYRDEGEKYKVSSKFIGIGEVLLKLLPIALDKPDPTESDRQLLARVIWLIVYLKLYGAIHDYDQVDLSAMLVDHTDIKRAYLQYTLNMRKLARGGFHGAEWSSFIYGDSPILNIHDATWLLDDARAAEPEVSSALLRIVNHLWWSSGYPRSVARAARLVLKELKANHVKEGLPVFPIWAVRKWQDLYGRLYRTVGQKFWWNQQKWNFLRKWRWWGNQWALLRLIRVIRRGVHKPALWFLVNELKEKDASHLARTGWEELQKVRGRMIAKAAKQGMMNYWPTFTPTLRHERAIDDNSIDGGVIIGLTGIREAIAAKKLDFSVVSDSQAQQLARYALNEINGFPEWFAKLVNVRFDAVRDVVMSAIDYEWRLPAESERVHGVLADLSYDQTGVYEYFIEPVAKLLETQDPTHPTVLDQALRVLCRDLVETEGLLRKLAVIRINDYGADVSQHMAWTTIGMQFDAPATRTLLERSVKDVDDPKMYMVRLAAALGADGRFNEPTVSTPDYRAPHCLQWLIPLMFQNLQPADDPKHPSGVAHSVTNLDEAVRFRDGLLMQLARLEDPKANAVLENFLAEPLLVSRHDWIRHLLLERCRRLADELPWRERDIRNFQEKHEIAPRNSSELFELVCERIQDIKEWVETGDDSPRGNLDAKCQEKDMRLWIASRLRDKQDDLYAVPEEHELANGKREDIRIDAPSISGHVVIELKQIEGSSYAVLQERLENQLIGDYLKASNANFGILLVSYTGYKGKSSGGIDPATGKRLVFKEIIQNLQVLANQLVADNSGIKDVKVFGIDFVTK